MLNVKLTEITCWYPIFCHECRKQNCHDLEHAYRVDFQIRRLICGIPEKIDIINENSSD